MSRTTKIVAAFCSASEDRARLAAERLTGPDAPPSALGKALVSMGWIAKTLSAEVRAAMLEDAADENEVLARAYRSARCASTARALRDMAATVREPTSWDDRHPFTGRHAEAIQ